MITPAGVAALRAVLEANPNTFGSLARATLLELLSDAHRPRMPNLEAALERLDPDVVLRALAAGPLVINLELTLERPTDGGGKLDVTLTNVTPHNLHAPETPPPAPPSRIIRKP